MKGSGNMRWKPIEKYNGLYMISDEGQVFSVRSNRLLNTKPQPNGYVRTEINIDGEVYRDLVHCLVAEAFIPNPNNYPIINHKDENPSNNRADNLEWCTYKYNSNYGTCIERRVLHTEYKRGGDKTGAKEVWQFDLEGDFINKYPSCADAELVTGVNRKDISKCALGRLKYAGKYVWSYDGTFYYDAHKTYKPRNGTVYQYDLDGNFIKKYETNDELRAEGFVPQNVMRNIKGVRKSYKGYVFRQGAD